MSAIFLSYRRDDSSGYAGRLFDNLVARFGRERVFMDIETLEPGLDFIEGIDRAIQSCGAVIAMIGPNWLSATNSRGQRRLDDPNDFIRLEIATALKRGVRVIPVLVHEATMPTEETLPEPLRRLSRLQSFEISDNRWEFDVGRLADVLEPVIAESGTYAGPIPGAAVAADRPPTVAPASGDGSGSETNGFGKMAAAALVLVATVVAGSWWFIQRQAIEPGADNALTKSGPAQGVERPRPSATPAPAVAPPELQPPVRPAATDAKETVEPEPPAAPQREPAREPDVVVEPPTDASRTAPRSEPEETPASPEDRENLERAALIGDLLDRAQTDLADLRLTRPAGDNAYERYRQVLALDPENPDAREGLQAIAERYHGLVEDALVRGELDAAERHLESARTVDPGIDWLPPMQEAIERQRHREARSFAPVVPGAPVSSDRGDALEACLSGCEREQQACRDENGPDAESNCLREHSVECDRRYKECMSDARQLIIWGRASLKSTCAGVHAQCERAAPADCAGALAEVGAECDRRSAQCAEDCRARR